MWVRLRHNGREHRLLGLRKTSTVRELMKEVEKATGLAKAEQRLLYRGKQMDQERCDLHDYDVGNDVVIDCIKREAPRAPTAAPSGDAQATEAPVAPSTVRLEDIYEGDPKDLGEEDPCKVCANDPAIDKCKECGCQVCEMKSRSDALLMCDECDYFTHYFCTDPPLEGIPDDDWYCPLCKNDDEEVVKAGQNLKFNRKKAKAPSATCTKKWGGGMATAGRGKSCTKVASNHFGPIPGIEVGMTWKYRIQISEEGVHRPPVGGIAGKPSEGACSIVLAGGYEDDTDNGDEFYYTGAGGRDLSGNKRTAEQSFDQVLEKTNLAIAVSCAAKVDKVKGAEAADWREGKPIRVVRSEKLAKHSVYAPKEGCRYDGIYKVVKYWPQKGKAGFVIWRYLFRRDDPTPAPWTDEGKKLMEENGFSCIYPPGYLENLKAKEEKAALEKKAGKNKGKKRKNDVNDNVPVPSEPTSEPPAKKKRYAIPEPILTLMTLDEANAKLWTAVRETPLSTKLDLTNAVEAHFVCATCQELPDAPVTTACGHNVCLDCMRRAFKSEYTSCPTCRADLKEEPQVVNGRLRDVLRAVFPGYDNKGGVYRS